MEHSFADIVRASLGWHARAIVRRSGGGVRLAGRGACSRRAGLRRRLLVLDLRLVVADRAASGGTSHSMSAGNVAGDTAHRGALGAAFRVSHAARTGE